MAACWQFIFLQLFDLSQSHRAANRMTKESGGVDGFTIGGWPGLIHHGGGTHAGGERETTGEGFAEADDVRDGTAMLTGEPFTGAAEAGVNLIENEQGFVLITKPAHELEKTWRRNVDAAAGLHRLEQDGTDFLFFEQCSDLLLERFQFGFLLGERNEMAEGLELAAEFATKVFEMRGVQGAVADAVIGAFERDDAGFASGEFGGLEGSFHSFKTGIAEDMNLDGKINFITAGESGTLYNYAVE